MQVKHTSRQLGCLSGPPAASSLPREQARNHMLLECITKDGIIRPKLAVEVNMGRWEVM